MREAPDFVAFGDGGRKTPTTSGPKFFDYVLCVKKRREANATDFKATN